MNDQHQVPEVIERYSRPPEGGYRPGTGGVPVLEVPPSVAFWKRVRLILFLVISLSIIGSAALITLDVLQSKQVIKAIARAQKNAVACTADNTQAVSTALNKLAEKCPDQSNLQRNLAWQLSLEQELFGAKEDLTATIKTALQKSQSPGIIDRIRKALELSHDNPAMEAAVKSAILNFEGKNSEALVLAEGALEINPNDKRLILAKAWALEKLNNYENTKKWVDASLTADAANLPLYITAIRSSIINEKKLDTLEYAQQLAQNTSSDHLWAKLATIEVSLPDWGAQPHNPDRIRKTVSTIRGLQERIHQAPPKLNLLGIYLTGRVELLAGNTDAAIKAFSTYIQSKKTPKAIAYLALATKQQKGCTDSLSLLELYEEITSPQIFAVKAQCELDLFKIPAAEKTIATLAETGELKETVTFLNWVLAIRKGEAVDALSNMPPAVKPEHWPYAVELYYQIKDQSNRKNIKKLVSATNDSLPHCSAAMNEWNSRRTKGALKKLNDHEDNLCKKALFGKLLRGSKDPVVLKTALQSAYDASERNLILKIDLAMASWFVDGLTEAFKQLETVRPVATNSSVLKRYLAQAYFDLGYFETTETLLETEKDPDSIALTYLALNEINAKKSKKFAKAIASQNLTDAHPGIAYVAAQYKFRTRKYESAVDIAEEALPKAGRWTNELAELAAKAKNIIAARKEVDAILNRTAINVGSACTLDELWRIRLALAKVNLRRKGDKYYQIATSVLNGMKRDGIRTGELLYNYGVAQNKNGHPESAISALKQAVALDPSIKEAYQTLNQLEALDADLKAKMEKTLLDTSL